MAYDYGMYTDFGNDAIERVVTSARVLKMAWPDVMKELEDVAKMPDFREAMDTVVRETVYNALGFKTPFYAA